MNVFPSIFRNKINISEFISDIDNSCGLGKFKLLVPDGNDVGFADGDIAETVIAERICLGLVAEVCRRIGDRYKYSSDSASAFAVNSAADRNICGGRSERFKCPESCPFAKISARYIRFRDCLPDCSFQSKQPARAFIAAARDDIVAQIIISARLG